MPSDETRPGSKNMEECRTAALRQFMAEIERGRRSGEKAGYIPAEVVFQNLELKYQV